MEYELSCQYDARQSFYGKAKIKDYYVNKNIHILELYSYGTLVAEIKEYKKETKYIYYGQYSQTTTRHQKEFFRQNGLSDKEIKELFKKGILEV
jgi:hypothetical protein